MDAATITKAELARLLGVSRARVSQYVKAGMPVRADGRLDRDVALAWVRANVDSGRAAPGPREMVQTSALLSEQDPEEPEEHRPDTLAAARLEHASAAAAKSRLQVAAAVRRLVDRSAVVREFASHGASALVRIRSIGSALEARLTPVCVEYVRGEIDESVSAVVEWLERVPQAGAAPVHVSRLDAEVPRTLTEARMEHTAAKAAKLTLDIGRLEGRLVDREGLAHELSADVAASQSRLLLVPAKVEARYGAESGSCVTREIREALMAVSQWPTRPQDPASELVAEIAAVWAPPAAISVSEWADRHRYLSPESAAEAGKWKTLPYQRDPMDAVSDPAVRRVVVMSATQMLKTVLIENAIGWAIDVDPGPILVMQPRDEDALDFSKERIAPMLRDTPRLHERVAESKSRTSGNRIKSKTFRGGILSMTSAGSPGNLARRAVRYLFCDEVDKYPFSAGVEGNPISLARKRMATFRHRAKEIDTCSPTFEGSEIHRAYEASDQREFYVPCPMCGAFQSLMKKWYTQVRWDDKLPTVEEQARSARYHCEACDAAWDDAARWGAVDRGEWRARRPFNGIAGFWISELYSPWKQLWELMLDYLRKKDSPEDLKTFVNTSLAEPHAEKGDAPDEEILISRQEDYPLCTVPRGGLVLTAGADVHPDRIEVEVVAWGRRFESWSVRYEIYEGSTASFVGTAKEPSPWEKLAALMGEVYPYETGGDLGLDLLFVDSSDQTGTVYEWVQQQHDRRIVAVKGSDTGDVWVSQPKPVETTRHGRKIKWGINFRTIQVSKFKGMLYDALKQRRPIPEELEKGAVYPERYCHFPQGPNYGLEHFRQLTAEYLAPIKNKQGKILRYEWTPRRARNEALDCRVYAMAAAWLLGVGRWRDEQWRAREAALGPYQQAFELTAPVGVAPRPAAVETEPRQAEPPMPAVAPAARVAASGGWLGSRASNWWGR